MGDKKRKRDEANADPKPKRIKNKAKYEPKGNKARKRAAAQNGLGQGANAIPVRTRDFASAEEKKEEEGGKDLFMVDATPMDEAELEERKKTKGDKKREREAKKKEEKEQSLAAGGDTAKADEKTAAVENGKKVGKKTRMQLPSKKERREAKKARQEARKADRKEKRRLKAQNQQKKKKEKKNEEEDDSSSDSSSNSDSDSDSDSDSEVEEKTPKVKADGTAEESKGHEQPPEAESGKNNRFIVFVGNLPFTANVESVTAHFSKISPSSVRIATDKKKTDECRGFGFVEFDQFDRMQTCLKLYHHSSFDDGKSPARKINVELTVGGGGKSDARKTKIKEKNKKLAEERAKAAKESKKKKKEKKSDKPAAESEQAQPEEEEGEKYAGVHPSRLNRMQ